MHDKDYALLAEKTRYLKENPKGVEEMCKEMEIMRDKAREEGRIEGRKEGKENATKEMVLNLHRMGMAEDFIARAAQVSEEIVRKWIGLANA